MSDLVEIAEGGRPWKPTPGTVPGEILHRYDMPLVGVIEQHGVRYLFQCWAGEVDRLRRAQSRLARPAPEPGHDEV